MHIQPSLPPGFGNVNLLLNWVAGLGIVVCILGLVVSGALLAIGVHEGRHFGAMKGVVAALVGCIIIGGASTITAVVTGVTLS